MQSKEEELEKLDKKIANSEFWNNPQDAQRILQRRSQILEDFNKIKTLETHLKDAEVFMELGKEGEEVESELVESLTQLEGLIDDLELEMIFTGKYDDHDCYLAIHPGAGGTESQDWAEMLLRMYARWVESKGYLMKILDYQHGEEAGLKSVMGLVQGKNSYGYLKAEKGVHRLVRISPFDANAKRHTSFSSVDVYPKVDDSIHIDIDEKDLRIDTYRSSGAGGQHVNVTDSAVRIIHIPTGIVVQCQNERSQHRNRETALNILKSRLYELKVREIEEKRSEEEKKKKKIEWGSQIRSYVLHPYRMVKDHRTGLERGDVDKVLDGDLDFFIKGYLLSGKQDS